MSSASVVLPLARDAMGTRFELVLLGADEVRLQAAGEEALDEIEAAHRRYTLFARDSLLAHVNRGAARDWVTLDGESFELFALADAVWRESQGAFDPTVAPWMQVLGLHPARSARSTGEPVGWQHVHLDPEGRRVRFRRPGIAIDLGGIAKGHALDLAARTLRAARVEAAILHGGTSSTIAIGAPPGSEGWRIALGDGAAAPEVLLRDATLAVSAPRGRRSGGNGHVLDPRNGGSASRVRTAAVVAAARGAAASEDPLTDGALESAWPASWADAWSTALVVAPDLPLPSGLRGVLEVPAAEATFWQPCGPAPSPFRIPGPTLSDPISAGDLPAPQPPR